MSVFKATNLRLTKNCVPLLVALAWGCGDVADPDQPDENTTSDCLEPGCEVTEGAGGTGQAGVLPATGGSAANGSTGGSPGSGGSNVVAGTGGAIGAGTGGEPGFPASGGVPGSGGDLGNPGAGGNADTGGASSGGAAPLGPLTVFIAGDSTVSTYADTNSTTDQAGWGQMLHEQYDNLVTVKNHAVGGRTARRFIDEGRLDAIWDASKSGDHLLVQFGTNDSNKTASYDLNGAQIPYFLNASTEFKTYLKQYIDGARSREMVIVLVTPPPRNSAYCTGGNGVGAYAQAMRELATAEGVALSDLNALVVAHLQAICPSPTPENFFFLRPDKTVDGTHFQENGARIMSGFVATGISETGAVLSLHTK